MSQEKQLIRCPWVPLNDEQYIKYHDLEWGLPLYDDKAIFEFLLLEVFQAGLSWRIVLHKRKNFAKVFARFDYNKVALFNKSDVARILKDSGIIRNRAKIEASINNAQCFLRVRKEFGTFSKYMWSFVDGQPISNKIKTLKEYRSQSKESIILAKDLKKRGFALTSVVLHDGERSPDKPDLPGIAAALRQFKQGSSFEFLCAIENGRKKGPDVDLAARVRVLRDGKEVYSAPARLIDLQGNGRAVFGALKLADAMTPGDYDLQVIAAERNGGKGAAASQWTNFTVLP